MAKPVILSGYSSQNVASEIIKHMDAKLGVVEYKQFKDKEIQTTIQGNIRGRDVVVVASAAGDPNKQEKETRLLLRAAQRSGPKSVSLYLPYMWYGRSDDNWDERNAPALIDTIETLRPFCDNVIIADPHNHGMVREKFLDSAGAVQNCQPIHFAYPFAVQLKGMFNNDILNYDRLMLAHADAGSTKRISRSFRNSVYGVLGIEGRNVDQDDWPQGLKDRDKTTGKSRIKGFSADVAGQDVVIFEDMVSSGGTVCELAEFLKGQAARSVSVFATHGMFTASPDKSLTACVEDINKSALDALFIMDTYDLELIEPELDKAIEQSPVIHTLNSAPYIGAILTALYAEATDDEPENNSISALLKGEHPDQADGSGKVAVPITLKANCPLLKL